MEFTKKTLVMISLIAMLGAIASSMASVGGYSFDDQILEMGTGTLTIWADKIIISGGIEITPTKYDDLNVVVQRISEIRAINLRVKGTGGTKVAGKIYAEGPFEIRAAEAVGKNVILIVDVDMLENEGPGIVLKRLVEKNVVMNEHATLILENLELPLVYTFNQTITLYGLEVFLP